MRKAANTLYCLANLKSIGQAMILYASEQKGYILGSPETTGGFLTAANGYSDFNCPEICQTWDWQSPVAKIMKVSYDTKGSLPDRTSRFVTLCNYPSFVCPENDLISGPYQGSPGSPIQVSTRMISYNTGIFFMESTSPYLNYKVPYGPKITKVGSRQRKIFMSDGGRWTAINQTTAPDSNEACFASVTANDYSDYGETINIARLLCRLMGSFPRCGTAFGKPGCRRGNTNSTPFSSMATRRLWMASPREPQVLDTQGRVDR